jgi:hypothetical protein
MSTWPEAGVGWFPVLPKAPLSRQTIVRFSGDSAATTGRAAVPSRLPSPLTV